MSTSKVQRNFYSAKRVFISIFKAKACSKSPNSPPRDSRRLEPARSATPDQRRRVLQQTPSRARPPRSASPCCRAKQMKVDLSVEESISLPLGLQNRKISRSPRMIPPDRKHVDLKRGSFSKKQITTCGLYNWVGNKFDNAPTRLPSRSPSPALANRNTKLKDLSTNFRLEKATLGNTSSKNNEIRGSEDKENVDKFEPIPLQAFISDLESISKILPARSRRPSRR